MLAENFFQGGPHDAWVGVDAGPVSDPYYSLIYKHTKAVYHLAAFALGVAYEVGLGGIGYYVGDDRFRGKAFDIEIESGVHIGKQAYRGRVDQHVGSVWYDESLVPGDEVCLCGELFVQ